MKGNHNFPIFILFAIFFAGTIFVITEVYAEEPQSKIAGEIGIPASSVAIQTVQEKYNKLSEVADRDGWVRIIVELDTYYHPEGELRSEQAKMNQREMIKGMQNSVMQALPTGGVTSYHNFKHVPYSAMTVNDASLTQLMSSPLVKAVYEDKINRPLLGTSVSLVDADIVHASGFDGSGTAVVIVDTGVDKTHLFFDDGAGGNAGPRRETDAAGIRRNAGSRASAGPHP